MEFKEAAKRIEDHMIVHRLAEHPNASKITEALQTAIRLLLWMNDSPELTHKYLMDKRWAIVGFDCLTASRLMTSIEIHSGKQVAKRIRSYNNLVTEFTDGTILKWLQASDGVKGFRCGKMWCDKNINFNIFRSVILPLYSGKIDDIVWL